MKTIFAHAYETELMHHDATNVIDVAEERSESVVTPATREHERAADRDANARRHLDVSWRNIVRSRVRVILPLAGSRPASIY